MSEHGRTAMEALLRALRLLALAGRTLLRGFGWTFVVSVLLLAALAFYAQRALSPERARVILVEQLQALLNREVGLERVVLSPRGIKLRGLRVRGAGGRDLLVCDTALATIKLKPLLARRVELDAVRLESPRIWVSRDEAGVWEISDLFTSTAAARRKALPFDLAAAETIVERGVLRVDDRLRGRSISLEGLNVRVDDFALGRPFPVSGSFTSSVTFAARTVTMSVSGEGSLDLAGLAWSSATARADRIAAVVDGTALKGDARVEGFDHPRVSFSASVPALAAADWKRHFGREWPLSLPAARVSGEALIPEPGRVEVTRLEARAAGGRVAVEGAVLYASTPSLRATVRVEDVDLAQAGAWTPSWARREFKGRLTGRLSVAGWPGRLQAEGGELALKGFGGRFSRHVVEGLDGSAWAAEEFAVAGASVGAGRVSAFENVFDGLSGSASLRRQNLVLERLDLKWGHSRLSLKGRVERVSDPKEVVLAGSLDRLVWEDGQRLARSFVASLSTRPAAAGGERKTWLRVFKHGIPKRFPDTVGHVRVGEVKQAHFWCRDVDLLWSLRGVTPDLKAVSGEARLRLGAGRVADVQALQESHKILRVIFLPFVFMHKMNSLSVFSAATAYPKTLDFSAIEGEYAVSRGVAATRYFHVDSGQLVAYAEGDADFGREKVDMYILTRLTSYRGTLPEWWVDELGRPAIGFRVKGALDAPELEPRFSKIAADEIERKVAEGRTRAKKRFVAQETIKTL